MPKTKAPPNKTTTAVTRRPRASTLVRVGKRELATGGWSYSAAFQHLETKHALPTSWCDPKCLGRVMFAHATPANQDKARRHFSRLFIWALENKKKLLARERDTMHPHRITRFRIYSGSDTGPEAEALAVQFRDMARRKELSDERLESAIAIAGIKNTKLRLQSNKANRPL